MCRKSGRDDTANVVQAHFLRQSGTASPARLAVCQFACMAFFLVQGSTAWPAAPAAGVLLSPEPWSIAAGIKKGLQQDCNPNFLTWCRGRDLNPHGIATAPSRQRVYQFHHLDAKRVLTRKGRVWQAKNDGFAKFVSSLCHSGEKMACSTAFKAHNTESASQGACLSPDPPHGACPLSCLCAAPCSLCTLHESS